MSWLAPALVGATLWLLGRGLMAALGARPRAAVEAWVFDIAAGGVALHLVLGALQLAGIAWSRGVLAASLLPIAALAAAEAWRRRGAAPPAATGGGRPGWGDALAAAGVAAVTWIAVSLRVVISDFVWHWGIKAKKDFLAGGVDYVYLGHPWNHFIHPDYPHFVPELYAVTWRVAGAFREPLVLLWSAAAFAAMLVAVAALLTRAGASPFVRQAATAIVALGTGAFVVGYRVAGGADLFLAFALVAGALALAGAGEPGAGLRVGAAAAFAAAAKIEGVPLALILVAAFLVGESRHRRLRPREITAAIGAPLLVILPWFALAERHHLFQPTNLGALDVGRIAVVAGQMWKMVALPEWHGLPFVLLALPLALLVRRSRLPAAVAAAQLAFYLAVYLTAPFPDPDDTRFYIETSFGRLLLHLVPLAVVAVALALDRRSGPEEGIQAQPVP